MTVPPTRVAGMILAIALAAAGLGAPGGTAAGSAAAPPVIITAGPDNYRTAAARLRPGEELRLAPGIYRNGLYLRGLQGAPGLPIVIRGPEDRSAVFLGRTGHNTIELRGVAHLELRNLTLDGRNLPGVDGIKAQGVSHHVTLENLEILRHARHQQAVAISTKAPAWNWVIRGNVIREAGTGLYLGESDGSAPFIHGLIERNVITETIGYGLQIKHQKMRPQLPGLSQAPGSTIIRHNFISKAAQPQMGFQAPRPNLLLGHFPPEGPGSEDLYEVYGNLLYGNRVGEPLFQGEGNLAIHDNLLVNRHGDAIHIRPHNDNPRWVSVFHNTVLARGAGIWVAGGTPGYSRRVIGNAVFAERPIRGGEQQDNLVAAYATAEVFLQAPFATGSALDLRPRPGTQRDRGPNPAANPAQGPALIGVLVDADRDFAGNPRDTRTRQAGFPGAYAGPGVPREGPLRIPADL